MPAQQKTPTNKQLLLCVRVASRREEAPTHDHWFTAVAKCLLVPADVLSYVDPNGQRQSKEPFNRAPTAIKKQYKFYVRQPDVATLKLGNLSSLMQSSGRRAYNELFFRWQLRLSGGSADHFCWYCAFAWNKLCSRIVARFADLQGVARIFFNTGKSVWGDLHLLQLFFSGEPKLFGGG